MQEFEFEKPEYNIRKYQKYLIKSALHFFNLIFNPPLWDKGSFLNLIELN